MPHLWAVDLVFDDGKDVLCLFERFKEAAEFAAKAEPKLNAQAHVWDLFGSNEDRDK